MRFVDGEQGEAAPVMQEVHQAEEALGQQALRRDVDQVQLVHAQAPFDFRRGGEILR
jgi:hypothetical protein